jgi:hypothetical protein
MGRGITATNFPNQTIYTFAATSRILGVHVTTLHKRARDGKLKTVNTPVGRRIHRDEIRRQCGESDENETGAQFEPAGERPRTGARGSRPGIGDVGGDPTPLERE